jgi:GNAT superfamily N-acetyltransferase
MSPVPASGAEWKRLIRVGQPPFWRTLAELSGGSAFARDGFTACVFPGVPNRSIFNSVFYEDGDALLGALDEIAAAYEDGGVNAWTVWVPEEDTGVAAALAAAGHVDDAQPRDMGMELAELREPEGEAGFEIRAAYDMPAMAKLNEVAYGWAPGEFGSMPKDEMTGLRPYFADLEGETVGTVATWPNGSDVTIQWVAVLPEARGKGVSGRLLAQALRDAREDGFETTTLQATQLGYPVYERLGYRDHGAVHMWERRKRD